MIEVPERLSTLPNMPEGWDWRPQQRELVSRIANSPKKIVIVQAEPGVGKTIMAKAIIEAMKVHGILLVRTRQLERQYTHDFNDVVLMEGRRHFECLINMGESAAQGPCTIGWRCDKAGQRDQFGQWIRLPECPYYAHKRLAQEAQISVHNYAYWLHETMFVANSGFRRSDVIVCDEAHELVTLLMDMGSMSIQARILADEDLPAYPDTTDAEQIKLWCARTVALVDTRIEGLRFELDSLGLHTNEDASIEDQPDEDDPEAVEKIMQSSQTDAIANRINRLDSLKATMIRVSMITDITNTYVVEHQDGRLLLHDLYGRTAFEHLRSAASQKLILMSAYLAPKLLMAALNIREDEADVIEAAPAFDRTNSKIVFMPTYRLGFKTTPQEHGKVISFIDDMVRWLAPRSGLIHVPSVALRDLVRRASVHRNKMITYEGGNNSNGLTKDQAIEAFREQGAEEQRILLGQSISTGVDIPYVPTWQIIYKLAFPPITDVAMKARNERDKSFYPFLVICELVQAAGRIKRAPDHDGTTFILDENFRWFFAQNRQHFPKWFLDALVYDGFEKYPDFKNMWARAKLRIVGTLK